MLRRARLVLALVAVAAAALPAAARSLVIERFDAKILVLSNSDLVVTETIQPRFTGSWNGIYRTIPVEYTTPQGFNYSLYLDSISATDGEGHNLHIEISRQGRYRKVKIWVPGASDATRTVVLRYRVPNGLRFFEDHDELYWNITGDEWEVPIQEASADVLLPTGTTGLHAVAFTGMFGSREQDASVEVTGNEVQLRMRRPLAFHEGLTAVVGWDKGFVTPLSTWDKLSLFFRSNWPLTIPIAAFLLMFWLFMTHGRDPRRQPIAVQYAPPDGLSPAEAGSLVDEEAKMHDITATIVDLAVRGYIQIEQVDKEHLIGLFHNREYVFHLQKPPAEWKDAKPHELQLLAALFDSGVRQVVQLSELQNHFYKNLPSIRGAILDSLVERGYFLHRPDSVRQGYIGAGFVIGFLLGWGGSAVSVALGIAPAAAIVAGVATGAIICGFGWFMPARTTAGERALENVLGFEDFLGHVEADHFERLDRSPETFEKFLPFAMALGVEKKWAGAFSNIYQQPPQWYRGGYGPGFQPYLFVNDLDVMSARAGTVMASAPRSSGSSGFGGGGFSGGGFGGGGGGGF